jgi:uncharacterized protein YeeX (DUF496 family)
MRLKLKNLRRVFRQWQGQLENLAKVIENNKMAISLLDSLEEYINLALHQWNFRK